MTDTSTRNSNQHKSDNKLTSLCEQLYKVVNERMLGKTEQGQLKV